MTKEEFIERARKEHGDKYDYSKVEFETIADKVCIVCPEHGEFWQNVRNHYRGQGCPKCGVNQRAKTKSYTTEKFIEKAKEVHGDKYDYSLVEYVDSTSKVKVICKKHGVFLTRPDGHLSRGLGCPECKKETLSEKLSYTTEEFIEKAREVHGDRYDYSKVEYTNQRGRVCIICPDHGEFWQNAGSHVSGRKCPKCAKISRIKFHTKTTEKFINDAIAKHGDKYDYSKVKYKGIYNYVTIICKKHGDFRQKANDHLSGCGCQKCAAEMKDSNSEREIYNFCRDLLGKENVRKNDRISIYPYELDIYIPSMKIGIEYNGLYWHSEAKKEKNYHIDKLNMCKERGIKLIQIFEDEYINSKDIVLSKIKHLLKKDEPKKVIYGRKVSIEEIQMKKAKEFLNKNHIQGFGSGSIYLGAFFENELIAVMSLINRKGEWELVRFASKNGYKCCGIGGKLFQHFVRKYDPSYVKSFADRRWTIDEENNLYKQIGFEFEGYTKPEYRYFFKEGGIKRHHKFGFRKKLLHNKYGFPLSMTENQMAKKLGAIKIYDCGLIKYVWKKKN